MRRTRDQKLFYYTTDGFYKKKLMEMEEVEERVVRLLHTYPQLRNSDKLLVFYYWGLLDRYDGKVDDETIFGLTNAETIRRVRQKVQSLGKNGLGLYLPTDPEVRKKRGIAELAVKDWSLGGPK